MVVFVSYLWCHLGKLGSWMDKKDRVWSDAWASDQSLDFYHLWVSAENTFLDICTIKKQSMNINIPKSLYLGRHCLLLYKPGFPWWCHIVWSIVILIGSFVHRWLFSFIFSENGSTQEMYSMQDCRSYRMHSYSRNSKSILLSSYLYART